MVPPDSAPPPPPRRARAIEVWAGFARHSPRLGFLGSTPDMNFALAAVRWTRRVRERPGFALDYTADLVPTAFLSAPYPGSEAPTSSPDPTCRDPQTPCALAGGSAFARGAAYGAGASPLGLTAVFRPRARVQPTLGLTGGFLYFDRREPTTSAGRFNFTATAEAGVRLMPAAGPGVTLTYRFHHISNGGTAPDNYAVASHVLSAGVRWPLSRRTPAPRPSPTTP